MLPNFFLVPLFLLVTNPVNHCFQCRVTSIRKSCLISGNNLNILQPSTSHIRFLVPLAANNKQDWDSAASNGVDGGNSDDDEESNEVDTKFLIKEIEGENSTKTGQFIVSKKSNDGSERQLFAFSTPPAPLSDSLLVVGATIGGLFSLVLFFLFSNKDIVPFTTH